MSFPASQRKRQNHTGHIDSAHRRYDAAERDHQRVGHAHQDLAERIVEIRPDQLQKYPQQNGDDVNAEQGVDQKKSRVAEIGTVHFLAAGWMGALV